MTDNDHERDKQRTHALFRAFVLLTLVLVACVVGKQFKDGASPNAVTAAALGVASIGVAATSRLAAKYINTTAVRRVVLIVIAYHALFGPVILAHSLLHGSIRNDSLVIRAYPHVVVFINSFE